MDKIKHENAVSRDVINILSGTNPNVFFEAVYANALNKTSIYAVDEETKIPFDLEGDKIIIYSTAMDLPKKIIEELRVILQSFKPKSSFGGFFV